MTLATMPPTGLPAGGHQRALGAQDAVAESAAFRAYCASDGVIFYGTQTPAGLIEILRGPEALVRARLAVAARHGYGADVLLVPGVPEAKSQRYGLLALQQWVRWFAKGDHPQLSWNLTLEDKQ